LSDERQCAISPFMFMVYLRGRQTYRQLYSSGVVGEIDDRWICDSTVSPAGDLQQANRAGGVRKAIRRRETTQSVEFRRSVADRQLSRSVEQRSTTHSLSRRTPFPCAKVCNSHNLCHSSSMEA